jgi:hypothetical protein
VLEVRKDPDWSGPCPGRVSLFTHKSTINDPGWWEASDSARLRLHFLDAGDGHVVTVHVETGDPASFEGFVEAATPIVQSFEFVDASPGDATPSTEPAIEPIGTLTVSESGCRLEGVRGSVPSGPIAFRAINRTDDTAAFNIAQVADRKTYERLVKHIEKEIDLATAGKPGLGHPSFAVPLFEVLLEPNEGGTLAGTLDPGTYGLTCGRVYEEVGEMRPVGALPIRVS